jgi:secreted trypsin-like serine protease
MRSLIVFVLALFVLADARPNINLNAPHVSTGRLGIDNYIIGGTNAAQGVWLWQLSQQRQSGSTWSHSCGASLLSSTAALSAAHCVDGASASIIRVIAGLYQRSDTSNAQTVNAASITVHQRYQVDAASYSNDIAIIHLAGAVDTSASNVALLTLPADNNNNFAGTTCTITGWGRDSRDNTLPDILQQADIQVITTASCTSLMSPVNGATIWDNHICLYDTANNIGSCNGDSGGPLNCPTGSGGHYVAGVTSWGISSVLGVCQQDYPSVYTRTSAYLDWIASNQ